MLVMFRIRPLVLWSATGVKRQWLLMYRFSPGAKISPLESLESFGLAATSPTDVSLRQRR